MIVSSFPLVDNENRVASLVASLMPGSGYVLCPGLPSSLSRAVTFESNSLRKWEPLFHRFDHNKCLMWYSHGTSRTPSSRICLKCTRLATHLKDMLKKKKTLSPCTKQKRISARSKYPKRFLTPVSRSVRTQNEKRQLNTDKRALKKFRKFDIDVSAATNDDILTAVAEMERTSKHKLEELLEEADALGELHIRTSIPYK